MGSPPDIFFWEVLEGRRSSSRFARPARTSSAAPPISRSRDGWRWRSGGGQTATLRHNLRWMTRKVGDRPRPKGYRSKVLIPAVFYELRHSDCSTNSAPDLE